MDKFVKNPSEKFTLGAALIPDRSTGNLYEQFVVYGVREENCKVDLCEKDTTFWVNAELLYCTSEKVIDESIDNFCFPNGVEVRKLKRKYSSPDIQSIMFSSLSSLENPKNTFVFVMTTDTLIYGCCVYVDEIHSDISCIIPSPDNKVKKGYLEMKEMLSSSKVTDIFYSKKCYCLLTRFPFFELHFEFLYSLIARDRLFRQVSMELNDVEALNNELIKAQSNIKQCLDSFYTQTIPKLGETSIFTLPGEIRSISFTCPPSDDVTSLADWCVSCTFRVLSLEVALGYYLSVLLEEQIVLISKCPGILSAVCLSLIPILRPLVWQGAFIPILPMNMIDCLDVPLPFVIGLSKIPENRSLKNFVVIDIDNNTISYPSDSLNLADMPKRRALVEKLQADVDSLKDNKNHVEMQSTLLKTTPTQSGHVKKIVGMFEDYFELISDIFYEHLMKLNIDSNCNYFSNELHKIIPTLPRKYRKFAKKLFETQHFHLYIQVFNEKYKLRREESITLYHKLLELVEFEKNEYKQIEEKIKKNGKTEMLENNLKVSKQRADRKSVV